MFFSWWDDERVCETEALSARLQGEKIESSYSISACFLAYPLMCADARQTHLKDAFSQGTIM